MNGIDPVFFDKKFSATRYMLRYVVGASTDHLRHEQLVRVTKFREIADKEIAGVIDENYANFNTSLARFTSISNQLEGSKSGFLLVSMALPNTETREKIREVSTRSTDGKNILSSKTKNLRELLLQKYEAKKVIDIINEIQYIEAAPAKIEAMMSERNYLGAVDMFTNSLDLVFSDKLVAFHAITGVRNALMECKQTIEDHLVHELHYIIYSKGAFAHFSKANQYSLASIENELSNDSFLDNEFDKHMFQSNQLDNDRGSHTFANTSNASHNALAASNPLEAVVNAVKKLHREVEVIGTLKTSLENELNEVLIEISLICRGIFNSSSYTSFDNKFTEKKFGKHDHSTNFQTFLRLLFHVLRRIAQRHFLVSVYFNSKGESWNYGMQEVISRISSLLERILGEYLEETAPAESSGRAKNTKAASAPEELFKLSRNKPSKDGNLARLTLPHDATGNVIEESHTRVCEPSVFHLPVVYDDLQLISKDLQQFFRVNSTSSGSGFNSFLNQFISQKWIPKVKTKAQQFLALKYRNLVTTCRLPLPSDTSYQPPSIDSLLYIAEETCEMMERMPDHVLELMGVLDATVLKWLEDCTAIVRDIREPTINHHQIIQSVSFSDLIALFHRYEGYQRAKKAGPIPYQQSKLKPASQTAPSSSSTDEKKSPADVIMEKELELESEFYDPDSWTKGTKGLLMDNSRIGMLAYVNSGCDFIAQYLQTVGIKDSRSASNTKRESSFGHTSAVSTPPPIVLQATSWRCSALADECLFFLRREIRLHCFYYLTQLISQRYDLAEEQVTMAQDSVLSLNINLSSIENALQPYLSSDKMALAFDGIDALLANILICNLKQMNGCKFTKGGVQQMLLNIGALHQGLTGILYSYPSIGRTGYQFEHAKRYYQLLNLSETQLEVFLLDNRKTYAPDVYKALWRVDTPHRVLNKGSVNKLDSILR
uniref:Exocyst complex component Sec8 n=1 Tax=Globisporangium ultimum (strain ATCC 200006 / CBS 805.95 / DAOM BR144) TaxID=431595 RepID=K3W7Y6_GLOUD